jgi:hypothetical protein
VSRSRGTNGNRLVIEEEDGFMAEPILSGTLSQSGVALLRCMVVVVVVVVVGDGCGGGGSGCGNVWGWRWAGLG